MTHPDTLQIPRAVVERALEALDLSYALLESAKSYHCPKVLDAYKALRAALQAQAEDTDGLPVRDLSKPAERQGVFRKFNVQRTDGSDKPGGKHHGCEYFVLDVAHDQHAKPALEAYAVACATTHPQLSADMRARYGLKPQAAAEPVIPAGFALVPIRATTAMVEVFAEEGWEWANVLAAAEAVTEGEYEEALEGTPPATQSALTAALSDCRTCQHLSEAWGVCEARPKCVGGEQYVYFPEKQLWDKTPRNDGQAAHQEMREALYAEFNSAVGRQHD